MIRSGFRQCNILIPMCALRHTETIKATIFISVMKIHRELTMFESDGSSLLVPREEASLLTAQGTFLTLGLVFLPASHRNLASPSLQGLVTFPADQPITGSNLTHAKVLIHTGVAEVTVAAHVDVLPVVQFVDLPPDMAVHKTVMPLIGHRFGRWRARRLAYR